MATDDLEATRVSVRAGLVDTGGVSSTVFTNAVIDEAVSQAVADLNRLHSRELVSVVVLHSRTVTDEAFTSNHGTWVALGNKPIDPSTRPVVTNNAGTTTYTEDTDYIIDYAQGRIQTLTAGAMTDAIAHKIDYEKSLLGLDISGLTDMIQIERLELYKQGSGVPQEFTNWWKWGDILWINYETDGAQKYLTENDHVRIWYRAEHTGPAAGASPNYPLFFQEIIVKGATAYALFSKHRQRNLQALTDATSARTALALADDDQTVIDTAFTAAITAFDAAKTALATIADINEPLADLTTALDKVEASATADMNTALDKVTTHAGTEADAAHDKITTSLDLAITAIALIPAEALLVNLSLDKIVEHLETDATNPDSAEAQLAAGDSLINAVNTGREAARLYGEYAIAQVSIARGFAEEAAGRVSHVQALVAQAAVNITESATRVAEGGARIAQGTAFISEAEMRRAQAGAFIEEAQVRLGHANAVISQASQYISEGMGRLANVDRHVTLGQLYLRQADGYLASADRENQVADRFLADARERHADYWSHLQSRVEQTRRRSLVATRQHPDPVN